MIITYMWDIKNNTNESMQKTKTDPQTQKTNLWLSKRKGREADKLAVWG